MQCVGHSVYRAVSLGRTLFCPEGWRICFDLPHVMDCVRCGAIRYTKFWVVKLFIVAVRWYPRVRYLARTHISSCAPRKAVQWLQQASSPFVNWATLLHVVSVFCICTVFTSCHLHQGKSARPITGADTCREHGKGGQSGLWERKWPYRTVALSRGSGRGEEGLLSKWFAHGAQWLSSWLRSTRNSLEND